MQKKIFLKKINLKRPVIIYFHSLSLSCIKNHMHQCSCSTLKPIFWPSRCHFHREKMIASCHVFLKNKQYERNHIIKYLTRYERKQEICRLSIVQKKKRFSLCKFLFYFIFCFCFSLSVHVSSFFLKRTIQINITQIN